MDIELIKKQAHLEVQQELFRIAVEKYKQKIREYKPFWHRIFPYKIILLRRDTNV